MTLVKISFITFASCTRNTTDKIYARYHTCGQRAVTWMSVDCLVSSTFLFSSVLKKFELRICYARKYKSTRAHMRFLLVHLQLCDRAAELNENMSDIDSKCHFEENKYSDIII